MRALVLGLVFGLMVGATATLLVLDQTIGMTGAAISSTSHTITLPASAVLDPSAVGADFTIRDGRITPSSIAISAGSDHELTVLAITGPGALIIPETQQSTPLLSNRQVHTFTVRFDEPGTYEAICRPCGTQQSLESVTIIAT